MVFKNEKLFKLNLYVPILNSQGTEWSPERKNTAIKYFDENGFLEKHENFSSY